MTLRCFIYARVSKDEASQDGRLQDPENQLGPLRQFRDALGWKNAGEFVDRCSGGDSNRPDFIRMLGRIRQRHADVVLVWRLDRFSREGIVNTLSYVKQLREYRTGLRSMNESWLDTTQEGMADIMLGMMAWAASEERRKISENTKAGLQRKRELGIRLGRHPNGCDCPKHREKRPPSK